MMITIGQLILVALSILITPFFIVVCTVIVLGSLGKSLGLRRRYVQFLLKVFEYGQKKISKYQKQTIDSESDEETHLSDWPDRPQYKLSSCELKHSSGIALIDRCESFSLSLKKGIHLPYGMDVGSTKRDFELADIMYFAKCGVEAIIEDDVTRCFTSEEIHSWNFLSRTNYGFQYINWKLAVLYAIGLFIRYMVLLPFRLVLATVGLSWFAFANTVISFISYNRLRRLLVRNVSLMCYRILARAMSLIVTFHNTENRPTNGITVANHTSPIDCILLSIDNVYSLVGQAHDGIIGLVQRTSAKACEHIWFERSESRDRNAVAKRLKDHVSDKDKPPILIFPEGTCINNTSVMMFKKGSFEVCDVIHPVAIKYDPRFGDAFWNSSKQSMVSHLFDILTSWALVVHVWYLPPMTRLSSEDAVSFANRVKAEIARKGGLVDLEWDGQLKRSTVKDSWKSLPQMQYSKMIQTN